MRSSALWWEATYITIHNKTYDILVDFTKIKESHTRTQAQECWTPENQLKSLKQEHTTFFYSRILGNIITKSGTDEFYTTLQNYAVVELSNDGPLLLWLILTHFHTSTITYKEHIKDNIRTCSLSTNHNDDVQTYLIWLRHQIDILSSTNINEHDNNSDLIEPIFLQLLTTKSSRLKCIIEDWHLKYHNEERSFTPLSLVDAADCKCKPLRCINQLDTEADPAITALHAKLKQQA